MELTKIVRYERLPEGTDVDASIYAYRDTVRKMIQDRYPDASVSVEPHSGGYDLGARVEVRVTGVDEAERSNVEALVSQAWESRDWLVQRE